MRHDPLLNALNVIKLLKIKKLTVKQIVYETDIKTRTVYRLLEVISLCLPLCQEKLEFEKAKIYWIMP